MPSTSIDTEELLSSGQAWNGQTYERYPAGKPKLTVMKMHIPAHSELPWHTHPMPNAAYVLSGQLTVEDKETGETHTVRAGEALNETVESAHRGYTTDEPAVLVITYAGVEGQAISEPLPGEPSEF
ncbi:cupin domain-containing protein [Nissabacter sp. SGAir0207]|uniref:cupin domain-containing protein n=1 Tax=Nissabacter sp. SGAir0207 TaxID=2126321 RepID=UPI0010CCF165|nr:cupin domain-containing protein [Nissabacter sp. SGAir0207]QCR38411.1 cupin [Nissabacter sp. SGAir0207]